jgi:hypothetical protein
MTTHNFLWEFLHRVVALNISPTLQEKSEESSEGENLSIGCNRDMRSL